MEYTASLFVCLLVKQWACAASLWFGCCIHAGLGQAGVEEVLRDDLDGSLIHDDGRR